MSSSSKRAALFAAAAFTLAASPVLSHAEEKTTAAADSATLSDITVTARASEKVATTGTKTDTPIIETPQSISVITADQIALRGALSVQDVLNYTAGVRSDNYGNDGRIDGYSVRGATPAQFLDGMRTPYGVYNTTRVDPYALERVEVLRGPSSVLYGQGTVGGVVNLASKRPLFERAGELIASYGTFNRFQIQGDITGPLVADKLAFRLTGVWRDADTQVDYIKDNRYYLGASLTFRPWEGTDWTLLAARQQDMTGSTTQFFPWEGTIFANPNGRIDTDTFQGEPTWEKYAPRQTNISSFFTQRIADWLEFRQNARASLGKVSYLTMYPNSYTAPTNPWVQPGQAGYTGPKRSIARYISSSFPEVQNYSVDNQLQAKFETGPLAHTLVGGLDAQSYKQKLVAAGARLTTPIDLYNPVYGNYVRPAATRGATTQQRQVGYYLQDQVKIGGLNLLAGIRRDEAKSSTLTPAGVLTRTKDEATTYRLGALYTFENGVAPYVSYAESFLPVAGTNLAGQAFNPQMGKQWEAGIKYQPSANLLATLAVYDIRDTNRLTPSPTNPLDRVQTGEVKTQGLEFEVQATIASVYTVIANYTYTDAKVSKSNNPVELGKPLASVPLNAFSLWGMRRFDLGERQSIRIGAGLRYNGPTEDRNTANPPFTLTTPDYMLADAMVSYERDSWRLSVNVNNLFDKYYTAACLTRGDCFLGARRTAIASLGLRF